MKNKKVNSDQATKNLNSQQTTSQPEAATPQVARSEGTGRNISGLDERTMIREQERLAKEAKRKKNKKRKRIVAIVLVVGVWYIAWGKNKTTDAYTNTVTIEKTADQSVVYAQITEINGNEITYAPAEEIVTEAVSTEGADEQTTDGADSTDGSMPDMSQMPNSGSMPDMSQMPNGGSMPDMSQMPNGGSMPDMSQMPNGGSMPDMSQMPNGGSMPEGLELPEGMEMPDMSEMQGNFGGREQGNRGERQDNITGNVQSFVYNGISYQIGNEQVTTYIPVGTEVTTKLGTVTTFSRLAAGDYVALVMEKDGDREIIVAVYIVG